MSAVTVLQMPLFRRVYKKLHTKQREIIDIAINEIIKNPKVGQEKKGDLSGIYVYKFKMQHQEMLLAYEWDVKTRILLALGVHENFYRDLKKNKKCDH